MKRMLLLLVTVSLLLSALASCGTSTPSATGDGGVEGLNANASADGQRTIKFLHQWSDDRRGPYWDGLAETFMSEHPGIVITSEAIANAPYKEKLRVMLGSNDVPDLFFTWDGDWLKKYARAGAILDISSYLEADPDWKNSFTGAFLRAGEIDGSQYGMPIRVCSDVICYNKEIFAKYNLSPPSTWTDFIRVCETLKENGEIPFAAGNAEGNDISHLVALTNIQLVPSDVFNNDYSLITGEFSHPGYVEGLEMLLSFKENGYFNDGFASASQDLAREMFAAEQAAMVRENCANIKANIYTKMDPEKLGILPFPKNPDAAGETDVVIAWIDQFVISSQSSVPDECILFLKHFYKEENQMEMTNVCGFISPIAAVNANAEISYDQLNEAIAIINASGRLTSTLDLELDAAVADVYLTGLQELFTESSARTPTDVMAEVSREAQRVISESN